jgi:hypothetical protein
MTRIGDRVSGVGVSPCSQTPALTPAQKFAFGRQLPSSWEPSSEWLRYGRMLRPFPTRRLVDALYHVESDAASLSAIVQNLLIEPPQTAAPWCEALYYALDCLDSLAERVQEARPALERMIDTADADAARAATAMRALTEMLPSDEGTERPPASAVEPAPSRDPQPCPACDGRGGSVSDGHCGLCEGTGIDPEDPLFPA